MLSLRKRENDQIALKKTKDRTYESIVASGVELQGVLHPAMTVAIEQMLLLLVTTSLGFSKNKGRCY